MALVGFSGTDDLAAWLEAHAGWAGSSWRASPCLPDAVFAPPHPEAQPQHQRRWRLHHAGADAHRPRRRGRAGASSFSLADLSVDLLRRDGAVVELSAREFDLFAFLIHTVRGVGFCLRGVAVKG